MATTATRVVNFVAGNKKIRIYDIAFSGNYQDDGTESTVTAAQVGLKKIEAAIVQSGVAAASNLATGNPVAATVASTGASVEFTLYEDLAAAAAAPLAEKTDNEAFLTGQAVRCLFIGH
jgi:hypothetical protein